MPTVSPPTDVGTRMKLDMPTTGSALTAEAAAVLEEVRPTVPPTFVIDLFGRVPPEDLAAYSPRRARRSRRGGLRAPEGAARRARRRTCASSTSRSSATGAAAT